MDSIWVSEAYDLSSILSKATKTLAELHFQGLFMQNTMH